MNTDRMNKSQLRAACKTAGIKNASKMTTAQTRAALAPHERHVDAVPVKIVAKANGAVAMPKAKSLRRTANSPA